jgi:hypothetical protein
MRRKLTLVISYPDRIDILHVIAVRSHANGLEYEDVDGKLTVPTGYIWWSVL